MNEDEEFEACFAESIKLWSCAERVSAREGWMARGELLDKELLELREWNRGIEEID